METKRHSPAERIAYSLAEVRSMLGVSRSTVYRAIMSGELRTVMCRGRRLVPLRELARIAGADMEDWTRSANDQSAARRIATTQPNLRPRT